MVGCVAWYVEVVVSTIAAPPATGASASIRYELLVRVTSTKYELLVLVRVTSTSTSTSY